MDNNNCKFRLIITGDFFTEDALKEWIVNEGLSIAKNNIQMFPILNQFFDSFSDSAYINSKNIIFLYCLPNFNGDVRKGNLEKLRRIEKILNIENIYQWEGKKRNYLISQLTSTKLNDSFSVFNELLFYSMLEDVYPLNRLELYPKLDEKLTSDIKINYDDKENVFIEIGSLEESMPTKRIKNILNKCAEYLGNKCMLSYIKIEIDSSRLPINDRGYIDTQESINKICSELDRLNICNLEPFNGYILLKDLVTYLNDEELYESLLNEHHLFPSLKEPFKKVQVKNWIKNNKTNILNGFDIITTIYSFQQKYKYITFHTEYHSPSIVATIIRKSNVNHIKRHLDGQLYQLKKNNPNIIAIHTDELNLFIMGDKYLYDKTIVHELKKYMCEKNLTYLTGILLYAYNTAKSIYIKNMNAKVNIKYCNKIIEQLGINIVI